MSRYVISRSRLQEEELHPLLEVLLGGGSYEADQGGVRPPGDHEPLQSAARCVTCDVITRSDS